MSETPSLTVSRRDAAIAAALTGTVVVVLGYASGLGLELQQSLAQPPSSPSAPITTEQSPTTEPIPAAPSPMTAIPGLPVLPPISVPDLPELPTELPTEPPATEPTDPGTTAPPPDVDEPTSCPPALLEELPIVGEVTPPVTGLLAAVLGSLPISLPVLGDLTCLVGEVVGPKCCAPVDAGRTKAAK